jgi:hypothetical protein
MGVAGLSLKKPLDEKNYIAATIAHSYEGQQSKHDYLWRSVDANNIISVDTMYPLLDYSFQTHKSSAFFSLNHKANKRHLIKFGLNADVYNFNMNDSVLAPGHDSLNHDNFISRWDYTGASALIRAFIQWKWRITENMAFTAGINNQYFTLSNSFSIAEPRIAWKLNMKKGQSISVGAGMHSMTQPLYTYFYHQYDSITGEKVYHNKDMDFSRSIHTGIAYEKSFKKSLNLKMEAYYQYLYNIPVTVDSSSFSLINMGSGFARFFPEPLKNTGTGYNYGIELTLQKFFDNSFFFLLSGTLFDSKYYGSDGVLRNTSYNGNYIVNALAGKEFTVGKKKKNIIGIGVKITAAGGQRYGYVDLAQSSYLNELVYLDSLFNERQFYDYFRADLKISWKLNAKRTTHEIGLDLVNVANSRNLLSLSYSPNLADPSQEPLGVKTQLGFLPIFYYKLDLRVGGKKKD